MEWGKPRELIRLNLPQVLSMISCIFLRDVPLPWQLLLTARPFQETPHSHYKLQKAKNWIERLLRTRESLPLNGSRAGNSVKLILSRLLAYPRVKFWRQNQEKGIDPVVGTGLPKTAWCLPKTAKTNMQIWYNGSELIGTDLSGESF